MRGVGVPGSPPGEGPAPCTRPRPTPLSRAATLLAPPSTPLAAAAATGPPATARLLLPTTAEADLHEETHSAKRACECEEEEAADGKLMCSMQFSPGFHVMISSRSMQ